MGRACLLLLLLFAWPSRAGGLEDVKSVRQTALSFFKSLRQGKVDDALALRVSHAQWTAISNRRLDKRRFDEEQAGFVKKFAAALKQGALLQEPELKDVVFLPAGPKRKRGVVLSVFHGKLSWPGSPGKPQTLVFCFLQVDKGWRFWHRS